jgi:hypothetical protein
MTLGMISLRAAALGMLLAGVAACESGTDANDAPNAGVSGQDIVTQPKFDQAFAITKGIDYLPFDYPRDGCYARALYMSMELAAQGIESDEVFAFAKPGTVLVLGETQWGWHVAPMLLVGTDEATARKVVIDPAVASTPIEQNDWLSKLGKGPETPPEQAPEVIFVPGSDYASEAALADKDNWNHDVVDFAHMPSFRITDIQGACGVMHDYVSREAGTTPETIARKQAKVLSRTTELVTALQNKNKLSGDPATFSLDACATFVVQESESN